MAESASWADPVAYIVQVDEDGAETIIGVQYLWNTGEVQNRIFSGHDSSSGVREFRSMGAHKCECSAQVNSTQDYASPLLGNRLSSIGYL